MNELRMFASECGRIVIGIDEKTHRVYTFSPRVEQCQLGTTTEEIIAQYLALQKRLDDIADKYDMR